MIIARITAIIVGCLLFAGACSSDSSPLVAEVEADGFLLSARTVDDRVEPECIDLADQFLGAVDEQIAILGERTFAEWVTTGLWHVAAEAPEVVAAQTDATQGFADADCPEGYLAASVVAHAGRFELKSPAAAIWWSSVVNTASQSLGAGAIDDDQRANWLEIAEVDRVDLSAKAVIPNQAVIESVGSCDALAASTVDLLQQQLYLVSNLSLTEGTDEALADLAPASDHLATLVEIPECDLIRREALLRQSHEIEFGGAPAVLAYAAELDAAWTLWSEAALEPALELDVGVLNEEEGDVGVIINNIGNLPVRVLSVVLDGTETGELVVEINPGEEAVVPMRLDEFPSGPVDLEVLLQTPSGNTQAQAGSIDFAPVPADTPEDPEDP